MQALLVSHAVRLRNKPLQRHRGNLANKHKAADDPERRDGPLKAQPIPPAQASMGCATVRT